MIERAKHGDYTGLSVQAADGTFVKLGPGETGKEHGDYYDPELVCLRKLLREAFPETEEGTVDRLAVAIRHNRPPIVITDEVAALPCTCDPGAEEFEIDPCGRCAALGRRSDVPVER